MLWKNALIARARFLLSGRMNIRYIIWGRQLRVSMKVIIQKAYELPSAVLEKIYVENPILKENEVLVQF
jgi:hypothetical protein